MSVDVCDPGKEEPEHFVRPPGTCLSEALYNLGVTTSSRSSNMCQVFEHVLGVRIYLGV